jgi:hypothetical protein
MLIDLAAGCTPYLRRGWIDDSGSDAAWESTVRRWVAVTERAVRVLDARQYGCTHARAHARAQPHCPTVTT